MNFDLVTQTRQVPGGRQSRWPGPDDQDFLAGRLCIYFRFPGFFNGQITKKSLDGVNTDGIIDLGAITTAFARVIANPPVHRRHRIVIHQRVPGFFKTAFLRQ